jgi:3-oxoacyl-[acyl-carrier-protein] synthase III
MPERNYDEEPPLSDVYITDISAFLPNHPVSNDEIDRYLGVAKNISSQIKKIVLRSNEIETRYYALDPETGRPTHTNTQITAEAVRLLKPYEGFSVNDIECLSCGTTSPDQLIPGHAAMVHGELKSPPCEVVSTSAGCISGVMALKYASMAVALGLAKKAVATGSEVMSAFLRAGFYEGIEQKKDSLSKTDEVLPFDSSFLRWMLSDGAGAMFVTDQPVDSRPALRVDWIEEISFAGEFETCMYAGAKKNEDGTLTGWRRYPSQFDAVKEGAFLVQQDVKLLNRDGGRVSVEKALPYVIRKHGLKASQVDWLLPHYSSGYFRQVYFDHLKEFGFEIPFDKWFTNLRCKGNTGAASIYIMLEELFRSGKLKRDDRILCFVPESARFSVSYMMLTVV